MHLSTEEPASIWMLELLGEVDGDVPFDIWCSKKLLRKISSKNLSAGFIYFFFIYFLAVFAIKKTTVEV